MSSVFFKVFSVCHFFQFHHLKSDLSCAQCPHSLLFHLILLKNIILSALQNLPAAALDKLAAFPKTKCSLSSIKGVLIDESNRNCQTDRRLGYNRSKVRKPWKHWCFADFVQLRKHSERKLFDRGELQPHLSKGGRSNKLNTTKAPVMYCYMEHQARSRTMTGAFSISRTWREKWIHQNTIRRLDFSWGRLQTKITMTCLLYTSPSPRDTR